MVEKIVKGCVYYNCDITEEETWKETLKRSNLKILQIVMVMGDDVTVNLMTVVNGLLVLKKVSGTKTEIETIITNLKKEIN